MDPISQAALGAVVAQSAAPREFGSRVLVWGALAGALPDIDVVFSLGGDAFDALVTHRGFTHSLIFPFLVGPVLGWWLWRKHGRVDSGPGPADRRHLKRWILCMVLAVLSHPLLDALTPYGTQLLLPFSDARFAVNAMPIIDPAYTVILLLGVIAARVWRAHFAANALAWAALAISSGYLVYAHALNSRAERLAADQLNAAGETGYVVAAFPTILQIHYRRVVARRQNEVRVGYLSLWQPCSIEWGRYRQSHDDRFVAVRATREGAIFEWFAMGWALYVADERGGKNGVRVADLRYGVSTDPTQSMFALSADFDASGALRSPPEMARDPAAVAQRNVGGVLELAFADACSRAGLGAVALAKGVL